MNADEFNELFRAPLVDIATRATALTPDQKAGVARFFLAMGWRLNGVSDVEIDLYIEPVNSGNQWSILPLSVTAVDQLALARFGSQYSPEETSVARIAGHFLRLALANSEIIAAQARSITNRFEAEMLESDAEKFDYLQSLIKQSFTKEG